MAPRTALIALLLAAPALAGCGAEENPRLLSQADADALLQRIDEAEAAVSDGRCNAARTALNEAADQVDALPERTSDGLRRNLADWLSHARGEVSDACEEEPDDTPTPEPTATETPEETATPEETPSPEPTPTATPEETPTETPPEDNTGGTSPDTGGAG
jgi:outer membrane biosynthesis protein TonB